MWYFFPENVYETRSWIKMCDKVENMLRRELEKIMVWNDSHVIDYYFYNNNSRYDNLNGISDVKDFHYNKHKKVKTKFVLNKHWWCVQLGEMRVHWWS